MFLFEWIFKSAWNRFIDPDSERSYRSTVDPYEAESCLNRHFPYFKNLPADLKPKFLHRLNVFINKKTFEGKGIEVTDEMKILVSATAIQLTFGLDRFLLKHFSKIILYPKAFRSGKSNNYHLGEVNLSGVIVLSWSDFKKGNSEIDNLNLGLHEMAHALQFDAIGRDNYDVFFAEYFDKWTAYALEDYLKLKREEPSIFRKYGSTNISEFFSVVVEHFFENPEELKAFSKELYLQTTILLNQDPLSKTYGGDALRKELVEPIVPELTGSNIDLGFKYSLFKNWFLIPAIIFVPVIFDKNDVVNNVIWFSIIGALLTYIVNRRSKKVVIYNNGIRVQNPITGSLAPVVDLPFKNLLDISIDNYSIEYEGYTEHSFSLEMTIIHKKKFKEILVLVPRNVQRVAELVKFMHNHKVAVRTKSPELQSYLAELKKDSAITSAKTKMAKESVIG